MSHFSPDPIRIMQADLLKTEVYSDRDEMGYAAAKFVAGILVEKLKVQPEVRIVVGSAPSQDEFFSNLTSKHPAMDVDWSRVVVFHMDEYIGLSADHPQSFRKYQQEHFVSRVPLRAFHAIRGEADDPEEECRRLEKLLAEAPIDLACCGIGENGHLAFNDPPVADFADPRLVKIVAMDTVCRQQQVNDGCFPDLDSVPTHAITLTLPVFINARYLSCVVPARTKAQAVSDTLLGPVSTACPATLMRQHPQAKLFIEPDSASLL